MFGVGPTELIIILVLALIIFGPGKLPEVGKAIGRSIREFKAASSGLDDGPRSAAAPASQPAQAAPAAQPAQAVTQAAASSQVTPAPSSASGTEGTAGGHASPAEGPQLQRSEQGSQGS